MNGGRLGVGGALAGLAGSYAALVLTIIVLAIELDMPGFTHVSLAVASSVWIVVALAVGLPVAVRLERWLRPDASFPRRYGTYAVAGAVSAVPVALVALIGLPLFDWGWALAVIALLCGVTCALGGRAGVELWRRHERVRAARSG